MTGEVTVTGFGVRTAFGAGADALRRGVFAGVPSFAPTTRFDTSPYRTPMAGAAPDGPDAVEHWALRPALARCGAEALDMAGLPTGTEAAVLLGIAGDCTSITRYWREAAAPGADENGGAGTGRATTPARGLTRTDAGHTPPDDAPDARFAFPGNGTVGAVGLAASPADAAAARLADAVPAHLAESLAGGLGLTGPRLTFTNACVASAAAIIHACRLISSGRIDVAVCAGGYLVEEETFGKFDSGRALSRDGMVRPFSADRTGLLLGDGVAAVVLESAEHARRRGARPLADVVGWGAATDAHHIAQPHPDGVGLARATRQALRLAGDPAGSGLGYVNAHGTGTKYNDGAETRGLRAALGERAESIPVSSTKSTTGHLLEAAGVVEFVITMLALTEGVLPPTANFTRADPECDLDYVPNRPRPTDLRRALTVNAAFGGANTALVLERP
ncbi:beta-ketoacyl-[acyl-carrier-protein] synthase family protein [Streptomyces sp. SP17KL33]|uniref:beta-ketoacyl-[acyl-carrier-protein] synthase family protein n=1 Tax=Streptomyces sp. SP17KL33 TaxID=3002534 RepID=UPI002E75EED5|nr:beta-ketoacyl-[acyl-carrier-protein] synthase family protein [Streptomyces sp. SP17KL33]MEE1834441.1 beta-ketoacyl-[acyl-carrier-protein] synthase family protein [Streptomyces sp. SP17KL33]